MPVNMAWWERLLASGSQTTLYFAMIVMPLSGWIALNAFGAPISWFFGVGLPTLAIRDRMIEEAAGITRLLDKLETAGHVVRERSTPDRRQVLCQITPAGLGLLTALDEPVDAANHLALTMLDDQEKQSLVELLGAVRAGFTAAKKA